MILQKLFAIYTAIEQVRSETLIEFSEALTEEIAYEPLVDVAEPLV